MFVQKMRNAAATVAVRKGRLLFKWAILGKLL